MTNASSIAAPNPDAPADRGLLFGVVLDGAGGGRSIGLDDALAWSAGEAGETLWLHLDRTAEGVDAILDKIVAGSDAVTEFLVSNETRPRAFREDDTLVAVLRGVNFNPGQDLEDMIAMQIWARPNCVLTLRRRRLHTPRDVLAELVAGAGPRTAGDLVSTLIEQLVAKMSRAIVDLNDQIDDLETQRDASDLDPVIDKIANVRRECLALKRYMSPQYEALQTIQRSPPDWMSRENLEEVRETGERLGRYLDDLDVSKESAIVLQDDLNNRAANRMNRTMYMLSIVAAVFLPLSFVTGLLGINVGGMPGVDSGSAFWVTVGLLVVLFAVQYQLFRRLKWL